MPTDTPHRFAVVAFPYWPLTAQGITGDRPAAIIANGVIEVCSPGAHSQGIHVGQRRREALRRCSELLTLDPDPEQENARFAGILDALLACVARLEVSAPGHISLSAAEPVRYYGSEQALLANLATAIDNATTQHSLPPRHDCAIGIANSRFAAKLAGRTSTPIVASPETAAFLAPYPIEVLELTDFAVLAHRLGIHTLGAFAEIEHRNVVTRFGHAIANAHLIAQGVDPQPISHFVPTNPLMHHIELESAIDRVDMVAFAAKQVADQLTQELIAQGSGCTGARIVLETEHGESHTRDWHTSVGFDSETLVERVRWQLTGWLRAEARERPTAGITRIEISVLEIADATDLQLGLWGELSSHDRRAMRTLDRIRGLLGERSVMTAAITPGRSPDDQVQLQPWGQPSSPIPAGCPWPGQIPEPAPALVYPRRVPIDLCDPTGERVLVSARGTLTGVPHQLRLPEHSVLPIEQWAGPWLSDESWWEPSTMQRCARMQVICPVNGRAMNAWPDKHAYLIRLHGGQWQIEAVYD